jgi:hypothetical protein
MTIFLLSRVPLEAKNICIGVGVVVNYNTIELQHSRRQTPDPQDEPDNGYGIGASQ